MRRSVAVVTDFVACCRIGGDDVHPVAAIGMAEAHRADALVVVLDAVHRRTEMAAGHVFRGVTVLVQDLGAVAVTGVGKARKG